MPFGFCRTLLLRSLSVTPLLRICFYRNTGVNSQQLCMSNLLWKLQKLRAVLIYSVLPTASEGAALQHCPISSPCFRPCCLLDFTREIEFIMLISTKSGQSLSATATSYCKDPLPLKPLNLSKLTQMFPKVLESQVHLLNRNNCSSSLWKWEQMLMLNSKRVRWKISFLPEQCFSYSSALLRLPEIGRKIRLLYTLPISLNLHWVP